MIPQPPVSSRYTALYYDGVGSVVKFLFLGKNTDGHQPSQIFRYIGSGSIVIFLRNAEEPYTLTFRTFGHINCILMLKRVGCLLFAGTYVFISAWRYLGKHIKSWVTQRSGLHMTNMEKMVYQSMSKLYPKTEWKWVAIGCFPFLIVFFLEMLEYCFAL